MYFTLIPCLYPFQSHARAICSLDVSYSSKFALEMSNADSEIVKWSLGPPGSPTQTGECCSKGHSYIISKDGQEGACCLTGSEHENGKCVPGEQKRMQTTSVQPGTLIHQQKTPIHRK